MSALLKLPNPRSAFDAYLFPFAIAAVLFGLCRGGYIFWSMDGPQILPSGPLLLALGAVGLLVVAAIAYRSRALPPVSTHGAVTALALVFLSDWLCLRYNLFQGPGIRGELIIATLVLLAVPSRILARTVLPLLAITLPFVLVANFFAESGGRVIFSDDHAAMYYRLMILQDVFPFIPSYNVLWNAGMDAREFFATGMLNLYFLSRPFFWLLPPEVAYNAALSAIVFVLLPLSTVGGTRLLGGSRVACAVAALLSVATSLVWYRWCFKYGALGFVTSATLLPLNFALLLRACRGDQERVKWWVLCGAVASLSLMLCWSMMAAVLLPLGIFLLFRLRSLLRFRWVRAALVALIVINIPWMLLFVKVSNVLGFLQVSTPSMAEQYQEAAERELSKDEGFLPRKNMIKSRPHHLTVSGSLKALRSAAVSMNPLLIFLGIPGCLLLRRGAERRLFVATVLWLVVLGAVVAPIRPQLELERMFVTLGLLLVIPTSLFVERILTRAEEQHAEGNVVSLRHRLPAAFVSSFVVVGIGSVGAIVHNRSLEAYHFQEPIVHSMADALQANVGGGRALFSGFVLHELSFGHLAPLAAYSKVPLIASSPFHSVWWYTDAVPYSYRIRGPVGVEEYLNLMNVTVTVAHETHWKRFFASQVEKYKSIWKSGRFEMFSRKVEQPSFFLEGAGEVLEQGTGGVRLKMETADAVLRFNYFSFLKADGCLVEPYRDRAEVTLVRLRGCAPGSIVTIESVSPLSRLLM